MNQLKLYYLRGHTSNMECHLPLLKGGGGSCFPVWIAYWTRPSDLKNDMAKIKDTLKKQCVSSYITGSYIQFGADDITVIEAEGIGHDSVTIHENITQLLDYFKENKHDDLRAGGGNSHS